MIQSYERMVCDMLEQCTTYIDLLDNPSELTHDELNWFNNVAGICKAAIGVNIPIITYDHELLHGSSKEALGIFWTTDAKNPLNDDSFITIDCCTLHERYETKFNNGFDLIFDTLAGIIAHDLAHDFQFRQCKRHSRITAEFLERIHEYEKVVLK